MNELYPTRMQEGVPHPTGKIHTHTHHPRHNLPNYQPTAATKPARIGDYPPPPLRSAIINFLESKSFALSKRKKEDSTIFN